MTVSSTSSEVFRPVRQLKGSAGNPCTRRCFVTAGKSRVPVGSAGEAPDTATARQLGGGGPTARLDRPTDLLAQTRTRRTRWSGCRSENLSEMMSSLSNRHVFYF